MLEGANKKYASFAALGWVGVLAVLTGLAQEWRKYLGRPVSLVFALFLMTVLPLSVLGYMRETRIWQVMIDRNWEASLAVLFHVNDRNWLGNLYGDDPGLRKYVGYIESRGRGIFSELPIRWRDDAAPLLTKGTPTSCRGGAERLDPVPVADLATIFDYTDTPMIMSGWAWMEADHAPPATIIAVDGQQRIVGVARMTRTSASAEEWLGQKFDQNVGWFGFARLNPPQSVSFFALSGDNKHFCALGGVGNVR